MTLKRLQVKNYQCHEDLRVKLDPKITAIVGPSDVGKSAVLRAIRWLVVNRPLGDSFVREDSDEAAVSLWVDDHKVRRVKGEENKYEVDGVELKAVGCEVPARVKDVLKIDGDNFQGQHDAPFWFSLSAGEVARELNQIVDLSLIDDLLGKLAARHRKQTSMVESVKEQLEEAEGKLEELQYVDDMDEDLCVLEEDKARLDVLKKELGFIEEDLVDWEKIEKEKEEMGERLARLEVMELDLVGLIELYEDSLAAYKKYTYLEDLVSGVEQKQRLLSSAEEDFREALNELDEFLEGKCPLCGQELEDDECLKL